MDKLRDDQEMITIQANKMKQEPIRFIKHKKNLEKAIKSMEADLTKCEEDSAANEKELDYIRTAVSDREEDLKQLQADIQEYTAHHEDIK
jgi:hypothetical protein